MDFTLPVNAMNLMIELITCNTNKNFGRGDRQQPPRVEGPKSSKIESIHQVQGIDSVIMSLPKEIA